MSSTSEIDLKRSSSGLARFSTCDLDQRDPVAAWREVYSRNLFNLDIEALGDRPFHADVSLRALPGINVLEGTRSPSRTSLTRSLLPNAPDALVLAVLTKGRALAAQLGRDIEIPMGGAVLMSTTELASHTLEDNGCLLSFSVPRALIAPLVTDVDASLMRSFVPEAEGLRLLVGYARTAMAMDVAASPELKGLVGTHLRDLIAMLLGARRDVGELLSERGVRAARQRAIRDAILAQLNRPDLSAETVASSLRITANYVRKLLQAQGMSFSDYVLSLRLERVFAMLSDPRLRSRAISAIALDAGFNDISYFNRCFRLRFHKTPSDVRALI